MIASNSIHAMIANGDWDSLRSALTKMSNSEFRKTEGQVRSHILPLLDNDAFWAAYAQLVMFRRQSFISGILAIGHLARSGKLSLDNDDARGVASWLAENSPESVAKVLRMALPLLQSYEQVEAFLSVFKMESAAQCASVLLQEDAVHTYYALFNLLKQHCDDHTLIYQTCLGLIKKNTDLSFNMASIVRIYFDVKEIKSTFSLSVQPYELSYIDKSYDNFVRVLNGKRPTV